MAWYNSTTKYIGTCRHVTGSRGGGVRKSIRGIMLVYYPTTGYLILLLGRAHTSTATYLTACDLATYGYLLSHLAALAPLGCGRPYSRASGPDRAKRTGEKR
ncbi:hypothetical protein CIB48_g10638 [Xylaria polymorpha]|nr:hypothetical protein CIB48_g10638 [Xylaria polymorpha]